MSRVLIGGTVNVQKCKCCMELQICALCTAEVVLFLSPTTKGEQSPQKECPKVVVWVSPNKAAPRPVCAGRHGGDLRCQVVFYYTMHLYRDVQGCLSIRMAATFTLSSSFISCRTEAGGVAP